MSTGTPSLKAPHKLRPGRTVILALPMRKLRLTSIQSLAWTHAISGRVGTSKPMSSDSESITQQCFFIFIWE